MNELKLSLAGSVDPSDLLREDKGPPELLQNLNKAQGEAHPSSSGDSTAADPSLLPSSPIQYRAGGGGLQLPDVDGELAADFISPLYSKAHPHHQPPAHPFHPDASLIQGFTLLETMISIDPSMTRLCALLDGDDSTSETTFFMLKAFMYRNLTQPWIREPEGGHPPELHPFQMTIAHVESSFRMLEEIDFEELWGADAVREFLKRVTGDWRPPAGAAAAVDEGEGLEGPERRMRLSIKERYRPSNILAAARAARAAYSSFRWRRNEWTKE